MESGAPSAHAQVQYAATTDRLTARMALHRHGTNPQPWFSWLRERLPLTGDVLEVGAGTGELWNHIPYRPVTLVDFSAAMCRRLRAVPGALVVRADAAHLPFADASFDTAVANHMLYHVDDPDGVLREFARVLCPGGRLAVAVNGSDHLAELDAIGVAVGRPDLGRSDTRNDVTAETGPAYVARHFTGVTVERYPGDLRIPSAEPVLAYLASMADEPLTAGQVAAAKALVAARIADEGSFRVRKHTVLVTGRRMNSH